MTGFALHSVAVLHAVTAAAADTTAKNANGGEGLLVFLVLTVAVVFLLRSMTKRLKKVDKINFDDQPADANTTSKRRTPRP
jgi:hypothetical protein